MHLYRIIPLLNLLKKSLLSREAEQRLNTSVSSSSTSELMLLWCSYYGIFIKLKFQKLKMMSGVSQV